MAAVASGRRSFSGPATISTVHSAGTVFSRRRRTFFVSYWLRPRAGFAPERPPSQVSPPARDLDGGVGDVLLGVVGGPLSPVAALDDEDRPGAPHVEGLGLGRALDGGHVLDLEPAGEGLG